MQRSESSLGDGAGMKRSLLLLFVLLWPLVTWAGQHAVIFNVGNATGGTRTYGSIEMQGSHTEFTAPSAGEITAMHVVCDGVPGDDTTNYDTWTWQTATGTNALANSVVTCKTGASATCDYSGAGFTFAATDRLVVTKVATGAPTDRWCRITSTLLNTDGTSHAAWIMWSGSYNSTLPGTSYCGASRANFQTSLNCTETTATNAAMMVPVSGGTIAGLGVTLDGAPGASKSEAFEICDLDVGTGACDTTGNGLTGMSVTISGASQYNGTSTTCTNNCTPAAGHRLVLKATAGSSGAQNYRSFIIELSGVGQIVTTGDDSQTGTTYGNFGKDNASGNGSWWRSATIAGRTISLDRAACLRNLSVRITGSSPVNLIVACSGTTTSPSCTTSDPRPYCTTSSNVCSDTTNTVNLSAGDYFAFQSIRTSGTGTTTTAAFEIVDQADCAGAPTATPTVATATPTNTPTATPTPTSTSTGTPTPTASATFSPTPTSTARVTFDGYAASFYYGVCPNTCDALRGMANSQAGWQPVLGCTAPTGTAAWSEGYWTAAAQPTPGARLEGIGGCQAAWIAVPGYTPPATDVPMGFDGWFWMGLPTPTADLVGRQLGGAGWEVLP